MKKLLPALFLASAMSAPVLAGEVDAAAVNTFESGTPAVAAEVNDNFAALISAINDNATRIAALEDAVPDSIAGSWSVVGLNLDLAADSANAGIADMYSEITLEGESGSLTFDSAGTFTGSLSYNRVRLAQDLFCEDNSALSIPDECYNSFEPVTGTPSESLVGTWTDNGSSVTLDLGGGESVTLLKGSNDLLILGESGIIGTEPVGADASLTLLVRD